MFIKRLRSVIILILIITLVNSGVFIFLKTDHNENVVLKMNVLSQEADIYQIFYSFDGQFSEDKSIKNEYTKVNDNQELLFELPYNIQFLRIDWGTRPANITISNIYFEYKKSHIRMTYNLIENSSNINNISNIKTSKDRLKITTDGNDPFTVIDIEKMNLENSIKNIQQKSELVKKIIICIIIDIFIYIFMSKFKRICSLIKEIYKNRKLIMKLSVNDFKTKYAGSYFGVIWAFIQPVVTVVVYWFVFQIAFKTDVINGYPFVLWLILGLVPWFFYSEAIIGGSNSLHEYNYLVKKVVFPISVLPIIKVISALFIHLFFISFTIILFIAYGYRPDLYIIQLIYYSFCILILVLGLSYLNASIVVFFKDMSQLINILLQIGMWMTPIVWNKELIPKNLEWLFKLNPMYYIVDGYRNTFINKCWFWEDVNSTLYFWLVTMCIFGLGAVIFKRLKVHFADVL